MKIYHLLLLLLLTTECFCQELSHATLEKLSVSQCKRSSGSFELKLASSFRIKNDSERDLLVTKRIEVIPAIYIALSQKDAEENKFPIKINEEYGASQEPPKAPELENFDVLKSGSSFQRDFAPITLTATTKTHISNTLQLKPGQYWIKLGFSALPSYFATHHEEIAAYKQKWESRGVLDDTLIWSEPFLLSIRVPKKVAKCH